MFNINDLDPEIYLRGSYLTLDFETTNNHKGDAYADNSLVLAVWRIRGRTRYKWGNVYQQRELLDDIQSVDFIIAHNAKFELKWLKLIGLDLTKVLVYDTQIGEYVLAGNRSRLTDLALGKAAPRYGEGTKDRFIDCSMKAGICPSELPRSFLLRRCKKDVRQTEAIFKKQVRKLVERSLLPVMYTRCIFTPCLADMEYNGLKLDAERVTNEYNSVKDELEEVTREMNIFTGGVNPNSSQQMAAFVYDVLKFKPQKDRAGNEIRSVAADVLEKLTARTKKQQKFIELRKQQAKLTARMNKSLKNFKECIDNNDILRAQFNQTVTKTHRLSSSGAVYSVQFQNLPREYKKLFTARNPGWYIGEIDGCFTKDHRMLMSDGSWKPVQDVSIDDKVIAFDEEREGVHRKLRSANVVATKARETLCYDVTLDSGKVLRVSHNHKFLGSNAHSHAQTWITPEDILNSKRTYYVSRFCTPWKYEEDEVSWGALGAMIDCDGSVSHDKFQITQSVDNPVIHRIEEVLEELEFPTRKYHFRRSELSRADVVSYNITGIPNLLKIANLGKSKKAGNILEKVYSGKSMNRNKREKVISVKAAGYDTVYSIQTSAKTYIVEGYCNHNCQLEFRVAAFLGQDKQAVYDINNGVDVHQYTADTITAAGQETDRQGAKAHTFKPLFSGTSGTEAEQAYYKAFQKKYSGISKTQQGWTYEVLRTKQLRLASGLIAYWPDCRRTSTGWVTHTPQIYNLPVQSLATAEIIPIAITKLWHDLKANKMESFLCNTVHDSGIAEIHPDEVLPFQDISVAAFSEFVYKYLETVYNIQFNVPLGAGLKIGKHWGEADTDVAKYIFENGTYSDVCEYDDGELKYVPELPDYERVN